VSHPRQPRHGGEAAPPDETESARPLTGTSGLAALVSARGGVARVPVPDKPRITLGRSPECDIIVPDPSVSRVHAAIVAGSPPCIEDAGSHNGTVVLGRRLQKGERVPLLLGSAIQLGEATVLLQARQARHDRPKVPPPPDTVVVDPSMQRLYAMIDILATSPLAVLVLGETGAGKEVFARAIHDRSPRSRAAFVALSCAAMPEALLEAELFGYEKGAFTGATQAKAGLIEAAHLGTVFLDEVGELPAATQAKLLRVLESGEILRLGSLAPRLVDVRFVAATNRDLEAMVADGRFRADLFFRLNGFAIVLPPLRERPSEIGPLAELFAAKAASRMARTPPRFAESTMAALQSYDWPGNVRELRNVVERGVAFCAGGEVLEAEHLMLPAARSASPALSGPPTLSTLRPQPALGTPASPLPASDEERRRVTEALQQTFGNQKEAARLLGMSRRALVNKIAKLGIGRPRKGSGVP
jgi:two-component system response regulator AtoC